jgi:hypothetical protein
VVRIPCSWGGLATATYEYVLVILGASFAAAIVVHFIGGRICGRHRSVVTGLTLLVGLPFVMACLAILAVFLAIVLLAYAICGPSRRVREARCKQRFFNEYAGRSYLVWAAQHEWRDFVINNVLPVLPTGVEDLRWGAQGNVPPPISDALMYAGPLPPKPFLVKVTAQSIVTRSVSDQLRPYWDVHTSREVQEKVAAILEATLHDL